MNSLFRLVRPGHLDGTYFRGDRRAGLWVCVVFLLLLPIGCQSGSGPGDGSAETRFLSVGTAPPGGAFFVVGGAIAEVLNEAREHNLNFTAEATMGSQENIRRLVAGELELALSNSSITYFAVRGQGKWEQPFPIQAVMTLAPNVAFFITPMSSGVREITDLKNKRVFLGPSGAGFEYFLEPLLAAHGVAYSDLTPVHGTQTAGVDMLADGSAAAAFLGGAVPTASISQACATQDIFFVPFEPSARARLIEDYPFFRPAVIPAGTYRGQTEDFQGLDVGSMHLITASAEDEELIYNITRTLYEDREKVTQKHPAGRFINPTNVVRSTGVDFHSGAIRFYKETGLWPVQDAEANPSRTR